MAYITPNDKAFAEFVRIDIAQWNNQSLGNYLGAKHAVLDGNPLHTDGNIDQACIIDDRVEDWMERGNTMPSVTCIIRMREWMR